MILLLFVAIMPPGDIEVYDTPSDGGGSVTIRWSLSPDDARVVTYEIYRSEDKDNYEKIGIIGSGRTSYVDRRTEDDKTYYYKIAAVTETEREYSKSSIGVKSSPQWIDKEKINILVGIILVSGIILYFIYKARKGEELYLRKIAGLQAIDDAVGRATEMGKPILYSLGLGYVENVATIASLNILGEVSKKCAQYDTKLIVPNADPIVYTVAREIVKESYATARRPDAFDPDSVYFLTRTQFAYAAGVDGIMVREKPATNFFIGMFYAESLIMAETGATTGAIQIAGTDSLAQLPFFFTACDYTLIGEELYAASAYISREPLLLGAIKGEDLEKVIIACLLIGGSIVGLLTNFPILNLFR